MADNEPQTLIKRFYILQEERVQTYALFNEGHDAYLQGAPDYNFPMYRQLVHEITQTFSNISEEIHEISEKLTNEHKLTAVSKYIKNVQNEEKMKLEKTAQLQLAKQNAIDNPSQGSYAEECDNLKQSLREISERINEHLEELKYESEDVMLE